MNRVINPLRWLTSGTAGKGSWPRAGVRARIKSALRTPSATREVRRLMRRLLLVWTQTGARGSRSGAVMLAELAAESAAASAALSAGDLLAAGLGRRLGAGQDRGIPSVETAVLVTVAEEAPTATRIAAGIHCPAVAVEQAPSAGPA